MGKKYTIDEFKLSFKKPAQPKGLSSKKKDELEVAASKSDNQVFEAISAEIYRAHPDYYVELLSYKLAKHWDATTRNMWLDRSPKAAVEKVLDTLIGKGLDDSALEKALADYGGNHLVNQYLVANYPDGAQTVLTKKLLDAKGKERLQEIRNAPLVVQEKWFQEGQKNKNADLVRAGVVAFSMLSKDQQRLIAAEDPMFFVDNLLQEFKRNDNAVDIFKDKALMAELRNDAAAWKKLVKSTPILSLSDAACKRTGKDKPGKAEMTGALFDALVNNDGIDLTYFTCTLDQDRAVLTGMNDDDLKNRTEKAQELGVAAPDKPATQCHNLKGVLKQAVQANVTGAVIEEGQIVNMLLTKPLSGMPGGLLPKSFGGNVRDDKGSLTGQVMFTGVGGFQSHTWLIIDGVAFDPVLGTKGDQVAASVAEKFDWQVPEIFGKGNKGNYIVKDPGSKPAPNSNGFGTCYRLTKHPENYVKGVLGVTFKNDKGTVKIDTVAKNGPAEGALDAMDIVLKVDGVAADATQMDAYALADEGVQREFLIKRAGKKKKVKLVAASPLAFA